MAYVLVGFPLAWAVVMFVAPSNRWRPWLLPVGGLAQFGLVGTAIFPMWYGLETVSQPVTAGEGWLLLDALGKLVLGFLAVLFLLCMAYAPSYLAYRSERDNRIICANLFASLAMMTLVTLSHHLG